MPRPKPTPVTHECAGCAGPFTTAGYTKRRYCSRSCSGRANHAARGDITGPRNNRFNGGLSTLRDGRTVICGRDGSLTLFYRALMEAHLGRPLREDEIVHHVNGDCTDDRVENLQITTRAEHINMHRAELVAAQYASHEARKKRERAAKA